MCCVPGSDAVKRREQKRKNEKRCENSIAGEIVEREEQENETHNNNDNNSESRQQPEREREREDLSRVASRRSRSSEAAQFEQALGGSPLDGRAERARYFLVRERVDEGVQRRVEVAEPVDEGLDVRVERARVAEGKHQLLDEEGKPADQEGADYEAHRLDELNNRSGIKRYLECFCH